MEIYWLAHAVGLDIFVVFKKARDDLPQSKETFVNFDALSKHFAGRPSDGLSLTARQVHQLQLTG